MDSHLQLLTSQDIARDYVLNSVYEIEEVIPLIQKLSKHIVFLKELKKFRSTSIDAKIAEYAEKSQQLRTVILNTLEKFGEKTLDFPGVAKVTRKKTTSTWQVESESSLLSFPKIPTGI